MAFTRIPTELLKHDPRVDGYPTEVPVRTVDMSIDVFDDKSMRVGVAGKPAEGALFSFVYQPVLVACDAGFVPEAGDPPRQVYVQDKLLWERDFAWGGRKYRIMYRDYDDGEHYMVLVGEYVSSPQRGSMHIVATLHDLRHLLEHEVEERNYKMRLVKVA